MKSPFPGMDPYIEACGLWRDFHGHLIEKIFDVPGMGRYFVEAAPGLRELIMVGKIYHELEYRPPSPPWDLVVLDAPATGQALSVLRMPLVARETFGAGIVGRTAARVSELLRDPARCGVVLVTSPEPFAVSETLETHAALSALGLDVAAVIFNRTRAPRFDADAYVAACAELAELGVGHDGVSFAYPGRSAIPSRARFPELAEGFARNVMGRCARGRAPV